LGFVAGFIAFTFIFYPPICGWAAAWNADKIATWLSAVGTVGAVIAALGLALLDSRRREAEGRKARRRKAKLVATELLNAVTTLRVELVFARRILVLARSAPTASEMIDTARKTRLSVVEVFPRGAELDDLPDDLANALAQVRVSAASFNSVLDTVTEDTDPQISPDTIHQVLDMGTLLDGIHKRLHELADVFANVGARLDWLDFLDRGDGTRIQH